MRAFTIVSVLAATAMATTGTGVASPTGNHTVTPGHPTNVPTNGAAGVSQNIILGIGAAALFAATL
ncbi:hypothetical protein PT974_03750 [Cladobotryum mycophilum]|uniref:Uncharacterized protein n=1 Tax=Cladobotryum mycophilum TaxID=491253 RepID=A0ABR0SUD9_9HYPO